VVVTNATENPVIATLVDTPPVSIANTPDVAVTNTPSVTVANTPSVTVANAPAVPAPFQETLRTSVVDGVQFDCASLPTPAGAIVTVENISASIFRDANSSVTRVFLRSHNSSGTASQELPLETTVGNNQTAIVDTLLYAGPVDGDTHTIDVCLNLLGGHGAGATFIVTGTSTPAS
jgi:hypothetical protein